MDETTFVKAHVANLVSIPPTYSDDFQPPPESLPRKIPVFETEVLPPPERKNATSQSHGAISITIKSLKPAISFSLSVQPTDAISSIKQQLAAQPRAPPADAQRLLLKGKALVDNKLLQEYEVGDGATLNLMIKPGVNWDATEKPTETVEQPELHINTADVEMKDVATPDIASFAGSNNTIPTMVLSASPAPDGRASTPVRISVDQSQIPNTQGQPAQSTPESYHRVISAPEFWGFLRKFLAKHFENEKDADSAFEDFFVASKGSLSVHEIAKIRDFVGIIGMAGM
jgi:UV excision repair protein RAD23